VSTQAFELGRREELADLGDAVLSEHPANAVKAGEIPLTNSDYA